MRSLLSTAAIVGVVAAFVGLSAWAIVQDADTLVGDIQSTLAYVEPESDGTLSGTLELIEDGRPVPDWVVAVRMAVWTILFGGIPAAIFGGWLGRRTRLQGTRWSSVWSTAFLGGFVFQLSGLLLAPFMFIAFASYVGDVRVMFGSPDGIALSMGLVLIALCSALALRSWLNLRASAQGGTPYRT